MARRNRTRRRENDANRVSNAITRRVRVPRVLSSGNVTRVTGSEMVVPNILLSSSFVVYDFAIQMLAAGTGTPNTPGGTWTLLNTWLGRQATLFNKYKCTRMSLRYVPFCPTSTQGRVIIAWNGDVNDGQPANPQQITKYQNAVEAPVWRETSCSALISKTPEYVVAGANPDQSGNPTQGEFLISVDQGSAPSSSPVPVGSLYLDYDASFWSRASFEDNL